MLTGPWQVSGSILSPYPTWLLTLLQYAHHTFISPVLANSLPFKRVPFMRRANNVVYSFTFQIGHTELKDPVLVKLSDLGENENIQNK